MMPEELKEKCIYWFNTEKTAVSSLSYDEITARCHEFENAIIELQTKIKANRSKQVEILEDVNEDERQAILRYKPVPQSVKEALSPEAKKANKLEKEITSNMQSLNLDREMAIAFLKKMKPNLFA